MGCRMVAMSAAVDAWRVGPEPVHERARVAPVEDGVEEEVDGIGGDPVARRHVGRSIAGGDVELRVERQSDGPARRRGTEALHGEAVTDEEVVGDLVGQRPVATARRMVAGGVTEERLAPRLVVRDPARHAVAEPVVDEAGVVREAIGRRP